MRVGFVCFVRPFNCAVPCMPLLWSVLDPLHICLVTEEVFLGFCSLLGNLLPSEQIWWSDLATLPSFHADLDVGFFSVAVLLKNYLFSWYPFFNFYTIISFAEGMDFSWLSASISSGSLDFFDSPCQSLGFLVHVSVGYPLRVHTSILHTHLCLPLINSSIC